MKSYLISAECRRVFPVIFILAASQIPTQAMAAVTVSPSSLQFLTAQVGSASAPQSVTITNNGAAAIAGLSISASGDYADKTTCRASLRAGASCQVNVTFSPTAAGLRSGNLTVTYKGQHSPQTASLTGQAYALVSIAVSPQQASTPVGGGRQFNALASFSDGSVQDISSSVAWSSSNPAAMTISETGYAIAVAAGATQISATSLGISGSTGMNVTTATLVSLAVDAVQLSLPQGYAQQFNAIGSYSDGTQLVLTDQVAWTSSSPAVATVNPEGVASTLGAGSSMITAAMGSLHSSAILSVSAATLQSVAISPATISLANHTLVQLQATGTYSDGSTRNLTNAAAWSSSDTNIATVSATGRISSSVPGSTTITAAFGGLNGSAPAVVTSAHLNSINVAQGPTQLPAAVSQRFTATGWFSDGTTQDVSLMVHWMTSSAGLATIANSMQSKGMLNTTAPGSGFVTASYLPYLYGTVPLTVSNASLVSIAITPSNRTLAAGSALQFNATGTFSDNSTENITPNVSWSATDPNIVLVSNDPNSQGFGYGLAGGQAAVVATLGTVSGSTPFTVASPNLITISVSPQSATVVAGATQQLVATGTFGDGSTQDITAAAIWTSSSPSATVGDSPGTDGLAVGVLPGQATITAAAGGVSGAGQLTVTPAQLVSIAVTPANPTATVGSNPQLTATGTYSDGTTQDLTASANWSSDTPATATVSQGMAQALAAGQATITASSGGISGSTLLTVTATPPQLVSIAVNPSSASVFPGSTQQFSATGTYSDNSTQDLTASVVWSSSLTSVAIISNSSGSQGLAQAVAAGSASITAASGAISGTAQLTVVPLLTSITVSPASAGINAGASQQFTATGTYSDNSTQDLTANATWTTSAPSVATIGNAPGTPGLAQGVAAGSATVTATFASISGSAGLSVNPVLVSIALAPANPVVVAGGSQQFTATGTYSDNSTQVLTNQVTWSAAPLSVATIGAGGLAQTLIPGVASITATLGAASNSTSLTATMAPPVLIGIAISPVGQTRFAGASVQYKATGTYSDSSTQDLTGAVTWTSSDPGVAAMGAAGLATGLAPGAASINASLGSINAAPAALSIVSSVPPAVDYCQPADTGLPPLPGSTLQPAPPQSCNVPAYPMPSGQPVLVSTAAALQNALTTAQCGQWIQVQAGVVYQGNFTVPGLACPANNPVLLENSAIRATVTCTANSGYPCSPSTVGQTLPVLPQWTVASQTLAGTSYVPTLQSGNSQASLIVSDGAANWYIAGLEVTLAPSANYNYPIVAMGETTTTASALPRNITLDRVLIHPAPCLNDKMGAQCRYVSRGMDLNAVNGAVMFSNIWGIVATGQDTQAINVNNTVGPGLILGNYLEATGENLMFNTECTLLGGGSGSPPPGSIVGAQGWVPGDIGMTSCPPPADFTVRLNHFKKQMAWQNMPAGCNPSAYQCYDVKNQSEVKHGLRILYDANVFDTTFSGGQSEFLIANCWATGIYICEDLAYTNNLFIHGPQIGAVAGNGYAPSNCGTGAGQFPCTPQTGQRFLFRNNLAVDINGITYGGPLCQQTAPYAGCATGLSFQLENTDSFVMDHNTIINQTSQYQNALNFSDAQPTTDTHLQLTNNFQFGSPFNNGGCPGCAIAALPAPVVGGQIFVGDYWTYPTMWGLTNNPKYPAGITSLSASATPVSGQPTCQQINNPMQACWALDWALVGFLDFTGGNAGIDLSGLTLATSSPYHNAATDGTDIGANVAAVLNAISTVQ